MQSKVLWVVVVTSYPFFLQKEGSEGLHDVGHASVATGRSVLRMRSPMDTFFEIIKEVLKGIVGAISAHLFQKTFLNKKKTTRCRQKQGGFHKK